MVLGWQRNLAKKKNTQRGCKPGIQLENTRDLTTGPLCRKFRAKNTLFDQSEMGDFH
jgi:hypothetical protein